ncbi:hypothetical protein TNCV_3508711 [Trichonephila clavipes]|nr:hypothetical protein TNCV_3508711 [Trichonephila clavipes]
MKKWGIYKESNPNLYVTKPLPMTSFRKGNGQVTFRSADCLLKFRDVDGYIGAPDLRRDLNLPSEHLGSSIEILYLPLLKVKVEKNKYWIASYSGLSCDRGSFEVTRSTNGRGFPGQWAGELSTSL